MLTIAPWQWDYDRILFIFLYISVFSKIIYNEKQFKYPLTDKCINKIWSLHTVEYDSPLKRKDIGTSATTWMNLEDIDAYFTEIKIFKEKTVVRMCFTLILGGVDGGGGIKGKLN